MQLYCKITWDINIRLVFSPFCVGTQNSSLFMPDAHPLRLLPILKTKVFLRANSVLNRILPTVQIKQSILSKPST
jgi:hypothetical protein